MKKIIIISIISIAFTSSHFSLGYDIKQNITVEGYTDDMSGSLVLGFYTIGEKGKNNKIDSGLEFITEFEDDYGEIEISMYDLFWNWRFIQPNDKTDIFVRFGMSGITSMEVLGVDLDPELNFYDSDWDGGLSYGIGFAYNKKILFSVVQYSLSIGDFWNNQDFKIKRFNVSYLFN